jgi:hypothetical protein
VPISPSDLPWWGWLLWSIGAWVVTLIAGGICSVSYENKKDGAGCLALLVAIPSGLIAAGTGIMGVVLFVKWIWNS